MWKTDFGAVHSTVAGGFEEYKERFQVWIERDGVEGVLSLNKQLVSISRIVCSSNRQILP